MRIPVLVALGAVALSAVAPVRAGTNGFVVPTIRGQAGTTFDGWEMFQVGVGNPGNVGDLAGSSGNARLFQFSPSGQVLGSGNLYNGGEASSFEIRYSGTEPVEKVVLQIRALGTELKYDDVRLVAWTQDLAAPRTELDRLAFGPPPPNPGSGVAVSSMWEWNIGSLAANSFAISFQANELNLSLDSATLDVQVVPEPGAVALLGLGSVALWLSRRARR